MKKILSIFILFAVVVAQISFVLPALSVRIEATETDNKCGEDIIWTVDTVSGLLTLKGSGKTYEFKQGNAPWDKYSDYITDIVVSEGITHLLEGTFNKLNKAVRLKLPSTIEEINTTAAMQSLESIDFSNGKDLYYVADSFCGKSVWYKNIPDGSLVYFGSMLFGIKGDVAENTTVEIADGTTIIKSDAFYNKTNITNFMFPDSLKYIGNSAFKGTAWYDSQLDGLVYAGSVLLTYKGTMSSENSECIIKDGTKGIAENAFSSNKNITSIFIPASVTDIGAFAFYTCDNLNEVIIEDESSLKRIHEKAFSHCFKGAFDIPESVEIIEKEAFMYVGFEYVYIPANVKMLDEAFLHNTANKFFEVSPDNSNYCSDSEGVLFSKDKTVIHNVPAVFSRTEYSIPSGVLHIKNKAFANSNITKVTFNDELQSTDANVFYQSKINEINFGNGSPKICKAVFSEARNLKELTVPRNINCIEYSGLSSGYLENVYILSEDVVFEGKATTNSKAVIHCYTNSTAHKHAEEYGIKYILFDDEHYTAKIDELIAKAEGIYRFNYTDESLAALDAVLNKIDLGMEGLTQYRIDDWCVELEYAINNLKVKTADFSRVDEAIENAESIDRSLYTEESLADLDAAIKAVDRTTNDSETIVAYAKSIEDAMSNLKFKPADYGALERVKVQAELIDRSIYTPESLAELDNALATVDYNLTIDKQAQVIEWAMSIENAIINLQYLPADYSAVNAEINKAEKFDRRYFSEISLIALDTSINAVEYGLNITEQAKVDEFAKSISNAIDALEYASIVLRHESCGVIVSATTKEIKPDTLLTVEEVDPSNYEGTNFAVGGSIRSLNFYDINLVYKTVIVQPDGTVTVKIKLKDGVDPAKCKVYHVTEDIVNPLVRFASTIDGNYIVFETDHFSEFAVIEVETVVDSIGITNLPDKTEYGIGEQLDITGLKVVAHYSDGTSKEIDNYNVGMINLNSVGTKKVSVYYTFGNITKTAEFEITVSSSSCYADITKNGKSVERVNKKLGLFALYPRASIQLGCDIKNTDGCTMRWSSDNSKVLVDENGKITCKGLFGAKRANIAVEVIDGDGNVVARDTVSVIFYKLSFQLSNTMSQVIGIFKRNNFLW